MYILCRLFIVTVIADIIEHCFCSGILFNDMIIFICYDPNIFSIEKIIQVEMYTGKLKNSQNSNIIMKHKFNSSRAKTKRGSKNGFQYPTIF